MTGRDEFVDPQIKKGFNFGYYLGKYSTKENVESYMKHLSLNDAYKKNGFYKGAEAGVKQAEKEKFVEQAMSRDRDRDRDRDRER